MPRSCCPLKDKVLIAAQVSSVFSFLLTLWFTLVGSEICAGIAMLFLLFAACYDIKVGFLYAALALNGVAFVISIISIPLIDAFYEDDECENDDGTSDDDGFCTKWKLQLCQGIAAASCLLTAGLTWHFLHSGRYDTAHERALATENAPEAHPEGGEAKPEAADPESALEPSEK